MTDTHATTDTDATARAPLTTSTAAEAGPAPRSVDCVVIGAGAAGLAAAATAASHGVQVLLIDESAEPGGRHFGPRSGSGALADGPTRAEAQALTAAVRGVELRLDTVAWGVFDERVVALATVDRADRVQARTLVLATGGSERPVPFPGWTLPGVVDPSTALTAAAAGELTGRRVVVAGNGPALPRLARALLHAGAEIAAVCEAAPLRGLWRQAAALLFHLDAAQAALGARRALRAAGVPVLDGHVVIRAPGGARASGAVIARCDASWRPVAGTDRSIDADLVVVDFGLTPNAELARLAGCALRHDAARDAWLPERTRELETTASGVFVIGDAAGDRGPATAFAEGRLAGVAIAARVGSLQGRELERERARARGRLLHHEGLERALRRIYRAGAGIHELAADATILCRCEGATVGAARRAAADGGDVNDVKSRTRAGMGRCQGRLCATALAHVVARETRRAVADVGVLTPRPPVRPILLGALAADGVDA